MTRNTPAEAVGAAIDGLLAGRMIIVTDDAERENEGDLVVAAEFVTEAQMAFVVRHTTGIVCAPMPAARADELRLPPMVNTNSDTHSTAFTVTVDLTGTGSGVSAAARTATVRALSDPGLRPDRLNRPGHIFLFAREGAEFWSEPVTLRPRLTY